MAKICIVDGAKVGFFSTYTLKDHSSVCMDHAWGLDLGGKKLKDLTKEEFLKIYNDANNPKSVQVKARNDFKATRQLNGFDVDEDKAEIQLKFGVYKDDVIPASEIVDVAREETPATITKGGAGKAAVGGFLFGTVGAVAGGSNKQYDAVRNLRVVIRTKSYGDVIDYLITDEAKTSGIIYKTANKLADSIVSDFHWLISKYGESEQQPVQQVQQVSVADELLKFKQLLDAGVITQDEFDAQKAKLLK